MDHIGYPSIKKVNFNKCCRSEVLLLGLVVTTDQEVPGSILGPALDFSLTKNYSTVFMDWVFMFFNVFLRIFCSILS